MLRHRWAWNVPTAIACDRYNQRPVYRFFVSRRLLDASIERMEPTALPVLEVIAHTAADAANYALDDTVREYREPCEVCAKGPQGGLQYRYAQWPTVIGRLISAGLYRADARQLRIGM